MPARTCIRVPGFTLYTVVYWCDVPRPALNVAIMHLPDLCPEGRRTYIARHRLLAAGTYADSLSTCPCQVHMGLCYCIVENLPDAQFACSYPLCRPARAYTGVARPCRRCERHLSYCTVPASGHETEEGRVNHAWTI